jgi:hypothetical protein
MQSPTLLIRDGDLRLLVTCWGGCAGADLIAKLQRGVSIHRRAAQDGVPTTTAKPMECGGDENALARPRAPGAQRKVGSARHDFKGRAAFNVFL